jgi:hypothetical protein
VERKFICFAKQAPIAIWQLVASRLHYRYPSRLDGLRASELTRKPHISSHDKRTRTVDYCAYITARARGRVTLKSEWLPLHRKCADARIMFPKSG